MKLCLGGGCMYFSDYETGETLSSSYHYHHIMLLQKAVKLLFYSKKSKIFYKKSKFSRYFREVTGHRAAAARASGTCGIRAAVTSVCCIACGNDGVEGGVRWNCKAEVETEEAVGSGCGGRRDGRRLWRWTTVVAAWVVTACGEGGAVKRQAGVWTSHTPALIHRR